MAHVISLIYGDKERVDAFITAEKLTSSPVFTEFAGKLRRYELENAVSLSSRIMPQPLDVIELRGDFPTAWLNTDPTRQIWRSFCQRAVQMGLDHEFVRTGVTYKDVEIVKTTNAQNFLGLTVPEIVNDMEPEREIKLSSIL